MLKKILLLAISSITCFTAFAQGGNAAEEKFNNIILSDDTLDGFELAAGYYTISNNISDRSSSAFMKDTPGFMDFISFARDMPSYFFVAHKGRKVIAMIMVIQTNDSLRSRFSYQVVDPETRQIMEAPCHIDGQITEKRAEELVQMKIDPRSQIVYGPSGKVLLYGNIAYQLQLYDMLKADVILVARQFTQGKTEVIRDPEAYIKAESIGGKMDYAASLAHDKEKMHLAGGIAYNTKDYAIYLWGKKVQSLGISSFDKATMLWQDIYKRPLTQAEIKALSKGFSSK